MTSPINNDKFLSVNLDRSPAATRQSPGETLVTTENSPSNSLSPFTTPTTANIDIRRAQQFYTNEQNVPQPRRDVRIRSYADALSLVTELSRQLADSPHEALQAQTGKLDSRSLAVLQSAPG